MASHGFLQPQQAHCTEAARETERAYVAWPRTQGAMEPRSVGLQVQRFPRPHLSLSLFSHGKILGCPGHVWTVGKTEAKRHQGPVEGPGQGPRTPASQPCWPAPILGKPAPSSRTQPHSYPWPGLSLMLPGAQTSPHHAVHTGSLDSLGLSLGGWPPWGHLQKDPVSPSSSPWATGLVRVK